MSRQNNNQLLQYCTKPIRDIQGVAPVVWESNADYAIHYLPHYGNNAESEIPEEIRDTIIRVVEEEGVKYFIAMKVANDFVEQFERANDHMVPFYNRCVRAVASHLHHHSFDE